MDDEEALASGTKPTQLNNPVPNADEEFSNQAAVQSYKAQKQGRSVASLPDLSQYADQQNQAPAPQQPVQNPQAPVKNNALPDLSQYANQQNDNQSSPVPIENTGEHKLLGLFGAKFRVKDGIAQTFDDKTDSWTEPSLSQKMMAQVVLGTLANAPSTVGQIGAAVGTDLVNKDPLAGQVAGAAIGTFGASLNELAFNKIKQMAPDYVNCLEAIAGQPGQSLGVADTAKLNALTMGFGYLAGNFLSGPARTWLLNKYTGEQADTLKGLMNDIGQKIGVTPEDLAENSKTSASKLVDEVTGAYGSRKNIADQLISVKANNISNISSNVDEALQNKLNDVGPLYDKIKESISNLPGGEHLLDEDGNIDFSKLKSYSQKDIGLENTNRLVKSILSIHNTANLPEVLGQDLEQKSSGLVDQFGNLINASDGKELQSGLTYSQIRSLRQNIQELAAETGDPKVRTLARNVLDYETDTIKDGLEKSGKSDLADQLAIKKKDFSDNINQLNNLSDTFKKGVDSGNLGASIWKMSPDDINYMVSALNESPQKIKDLQMSVLTNTLAHDSLNNPNVNLSSKYIMSTFFKNPVTEQKTRALFGDEMFDTLKAIGQKAQILESKSVTQAGQDNIINGIVKDTVLGGLNGKAAFQYIGSVLGGNKEAQEEIIQRLKDLGKITGEENKMNLPAYKANVPSPREAAAHAIQTTGEMVQGGSRFGAAIAPPASVPGFGLPRQLSAPDEQPGQTAGQ